MHKRENKVFSTTGNEYRLKEIFSVLKEQKREYSGLSPHTYLYQESVKKSL